MTSVHRDDLIAAWDEIRAALHAQLGDDATEVAVRAVHGVLKRWAGTARAAPASSTS